MTREEIRQLLITVDPDIRHHRSEHLEPDYTYWDETHIMPFTADNRHAPDWAFVVHRYTKTEDDELAAQIFAALDADDRIALSYDVDHDPETGYIHHIYDCESA